LGSLHLPCTLTLVLSLAGCSLSVADPDDPAIELSTPAGVERSLAQQYRRWHHALYGVVGNVRAMATVMAFESFSELGAGGMGSRAAIPRPVLDNSIGNTFSDIHRSLYYTLGNVARSTSNILARLDDPGFSMGSAARDARTRAFAEFVRGLALGYVALFYDSSAVIGPHLGPQDPGVLAGYQTVMAAALQALDNAVAAAARAGTADGGFPLPPDWMPSPTTWTAENFSRLVRSYRARLRANVARTPAERRAVNWAAVIQDAQQGITQDHLITTSALAGPSNIWVSQWAQFGTWHQMPLFVIGMADVSGGYAAWSAAPLQGRSPFLIQTPDLRFPQGATRAAQQADVSTPCTPAPCRRYFRNRPAGDVSATAAWGMSQYDFIRFHPWAYTGSGGLGGSGDFPFFTKAELDLLEAEGHFHLGNYGAAVQLINRTRVPNGLPPLTVLDPNAPVPGGASCVPRVPVDAGPQGGGTTTCGNMFEALKYEKRLETQFTHFGAWFLDMRGWGDLVEGTGVHWATPYEDLLARLRPATAIYSTGGFGAGNTGTAARGTYGW
jgi:hypothetical protein